MTEQPTFAIRLVPETEGSDIPNVHVPAFVLRAKDQRSALALSVAIADAIEKHTIDAVSIQFGE